MLTYEEGLDLLGQLGTGNALGGRHPCLDQVHVDGTRHRVCCCLLQRHLQTWTRGARPALAEVHVHDGGTACLPTLIKLTPLPQQSNKDIIVLAIF